VDIETAFILLFVLATAVAIVVRRTRVPYTVALVLAGLLLGGLQLFPAPHLTQKLLFSVFLPGLIFEAAFHIDSREFRGNLITILTLAVPGVIASTALVASTLTPVIASLSLVPDFDWRAALVFGTLISATDPVAVVALFRHMGAPRRLTMLLDGESLLNDGTAIVFFTLSLSLLAGTATTAGQLLLQFLSIVGGGVVIGAVIGLAVSLLTRKIDDPMIEIALTTIAAYGSFVTAETLHSSGVIATVAAGMLCGNFGARGGGMSASTRVATETFWEYFVFALNSMVFLLIGFEIHLPTLLAYWVPILLAYVVVTLSRALVVTAGRALVGLTRERFPWRWSIVLTWGGLRGALPMVLVLSLPKTLPYRELLVSMTFGVAVLSILVHGLTMSGLLKWLGIVSETADRTHYEVLTGQMEAAAAALRELDSMADARSIPPAVHETLRDEYGRVLESADQALRKLVISRNDLQSRDLRHVRRRLLDIERDRVMQSFSQGTLTRKSQEQLLANIDSRVVALEAGEQPAALPQAGIGVEAGNSDAAGPTSFSPCRSSLPRSSGELSSTHRTQSLPESDS
jgi:CPA1 family monovalent cation:H+ antiporter